MKSYISLIPISAKIRKRQNRMTLLCIIFSVFLVTTIFSMADMGFQMEKARILEKHGSLTLQEILKSPMAQSLFSAAFILFVLVLIAGVLMISSTINSNVTQRTKFFGMMRCIGMSNKQIVRFVRLEALNWCKTAIPIGVLLGVLLTWALCAALRFLVGQEFSHIPLFGISIVGIVSGIIVGIFTVLLAARSPARRAAKVSPIAAVSGNSDTIPQSYRSVKSHHCKIETALGINHAVGVKKNLILVTSSIAVSIILYLSFLALIDFIGYVMPQQSSTPDISISSRDGTNSIDKSLLNTINRISGVKRTYGRRSQLDLSGTIDDKPVTIDVISYDKFELDSLLKDKMLKKGSDITKVYGNSRYVLATWDKYSPLKIGERIRLNDTELIIAGLLKYDPFNNNGLTDGRITLITSSATFVRLTGLDNYSLVMAQTSNDISDEEIDVIRDIVGENYNFSDKRDEQTSGVYTAFVFCVYGFLAIIVVIAVLNIVNNVSMSVASRTKQYGVMRAVGMGKKQITKMIIAEASTYVIIGCLLGSIIGVIINRLIFQILIESHFAYAVWNFPIVPLLGILVVGLTTILVSAYAPIKRINNLEITETINEL